MPDTKLRPYVVVRRDDHTLTVLGTYPARSHEQAIDIALEDIQTPPASASKAGGVYGAFPETHWREYVCHAKPSVVFTKTRTEQTSFAFEKEAQADEPVHA